MPILEVLENKYLCDGCCKVVANEPGVGATSAVSVEWRTPMAEESPLDFFSRQNENYWFCDSCTKELRKVIPDKPKKAAITNGEVVVEEGQEPTQQPA